MAKSAVEEEIVGLVVDFFDGLFKRIFAGPFAKEISNPLRRKAVNRQVETSADAASQSLTRFFLGQQLAPRSVSDILAGMEESTGFLALERIANPRVTPDELADKAISETPIPPAVVEVDSESVYRVALHSLMQVLLLVGPVMTEWRKVNFAETFELPKLIVKQLNRISTQLDELAGAGEAAEDDRYELTYRDYLLQRFYQVEAGTVRMATNVTVDLRELFVMPRVRPAAKSEDSPGEESGEVSLMDLSAAREQFGSHGLRDDGKTGEDDEGVAALEYVRSNPRAVIVGVPGSGKSTFLEWLQLQIAGVDEEFMLGSGQAIPLLLRVRQLDPENLPVGAGLIAAATASQDRATLMPEGWIDRQFRDGAGAVHARRPRRGRSRRRRQVYSPVAA